MKLSHSFFYTGEPETCPQGFNASEYCLSSSANSHPDKTALVIVSNPKSLTAIESWTFSELEEAVLRLAKAFALAGLAKGDRVMLRMGNTSTFPLVFFATIAAGGIAVPTSSLLTSREASFVLSDCEARYLCVSEELQLNNIPSTCSQFLESDIREMSRDAPRANYVLSRAEEPAYIVYTSGTSSRPKGVLHAQRAAWARRMMYQGWYGIEPTDRMMHTGALNWTYTLGVGLMDPWANAISSVVYNGPKEPRVWALLAQKYQTTLLAAVPGVYRQILKYGDRLEERFVSLRHGLSAGEKLPESVRLQWTRITGKPLFEALGMSECSTFASSSPAIPVKAGFIGKPQRGRKLAILEQEVGSTSPTSVSKPGLLALHRSDPGLMIGYWNQERETRTAYRGDWFITGDLAALDENGYLQFISRSDEVMNIQGYRVAPQEIENQLLEHTDIQQCACTAIQAEENNSTIICAFVVLQPGREQNTKALLEFARGSLAAYKVPREIFVVDKLPQSATGKLLRRNLQALYHEPKQHR